MISLGATFFLVTFSYCVGVFLGAAAMRNIYEPRLQEFERYMKIQNLYGKNNEEL